MIWLARILLGAALLLGLAGCGSQEGGSITSTATVTRPATAARGGTTAATTAGTASSSGSSSSSTPVSTGAVVTQANAICTRRNGELATLARTSSSTDLTKLASAASRRASIEQRALAELRALTAPAQLASAWGKVVTSTEAALHRTEALARAAGGHNLAQARALATAADAAHLSALVAAAHSQLTSCYTHVPTPVPGETGGAAAALRALQRLSLTTAAGAHPTP